MNNTALTILDLFEMGLLCVGAVKFLTQLKFLNAELDDLTR